jgi:ABC-type multidrug transport system ATPase subunit
MQEWAESAGPAPNPCEPRAAQPPHLHAQGILGSCDDARRACVASCFDRLLTRGVQVLDEATSALDAASEAEVQQAMEAFLSDPSCTVVLVTHRLASAQTCSQILCLHRGRVVERGTHAELMSIENGTYATLVNQQMQTWLDTDKATDDDETAGEDEEDDDDLDGDGPSELPTLRTTGPTRLQSSRSKAAMSGRLVWPRR